MVDRLKKRKKMKKQPFLEYWEEYSYMAAILKNDVDYVIDDEAINRISNLENLKIISFSLPDENKKTSGKLLIEYLGINYEIGLYFDIFELQPMYEYQILNKYSEEEFIEIKKSTKSLRIFMKFTDNPRMLYKLQLSILVALAPDAVVFEDESAEKILNKKWVELTLSSKVLPEVEALFSTQSIVGENGDIWIHTHGLMRCGITELELLKTKKELYYLYHEIISVLAMFLLNKSYSAEDYIMIGISSNETPIVATLYHWTDGILEYEKNICGTENERIDSHNTNCSIIFFHTVLEDFENEKIKKVEEIEDLLEDNLIFYYFEEETERMSIVAKERFDYVKKILNNKNDVLVKIGVLKDNAKNDKDREYLWFKLDEIRKNKIYVELTQDPFFIDNLYEGDKLECLISDIVDWIIYTDYGKITPLNVYLFDVEK